ncbi:hypothetical protein AAGG91_002819 [Salmonella enterica]|nr:hypothetical protein [Salmonella enterica]MCP0435915.1 hypothetical protein [Salmonella enterica subsp. enterica serovar Mbandaka]
MFTLNHFSDVVAVAKTFGVDALRYAMDNNTVSVGACHTIRDCMKWAANKVVSIDNFNDGNNEYSIDAVFSTENVAGLYITGLDDIRISRTGFGPFYGDARKAMEKGIINAEQLGKVLKEIALRNEAAKAFGLL